MSHFKDEPFLLRFEENVELFCDKEKIFYLDSATQIASKISYKKLKEEALIVAEQLKHQRLEGERVILLFPAGIDFIIALLGCMYARAVAIPLNIPNGKHIERTLNVIQDAAPRAILASETVINHLKASFLDSASAPLLKTVQMQHFSCALINIGELEKNDLEVSAGMSDLAFIQYTSGSTSNPKGVLVTFKNLLYMVDLLQFTFELSRMDVLLSWVPNYHDLGLVFGILIPLCVGTDIYIMSPSSFIQNPMAWLNAISTYRATCSGAPNFAYDHCADQARGSKSIPNLNLSSWRVALNGGDAVRASTLIDFSNTFKDYGFRYNAFYPSYGLAEAVLGVTCQRETPLTIEIERGSLQSNVIKKSKSSDSYTLTCSGQPYLDTEIRIVNSETHAELPAFHVGEIWVNGPSITAGYWNNVKATEERFHALIAGEKSGFYLRTGDLGFVNKEGALFITGRLQDRIVIYGENYYPEDLEKTVEQLKLSRKSKANGIVFSIDDLNQVNQQELILVLRVSESIDLKILPMFANKIITNIAEIHDVALTTLVMTQQSLPKTSSGKKRRQATKELYLKNKIETRYVWKKNKEVSTASLKELSVLESKICSIWQEILNLKHVGLQDNFFRLGGHSILAIQLAHRMSEVLNKTVHVVDIFKYKTIEGLLAHINSDDTQVIIASTTDLVVPLSFAQERLWFIERYEQGTDAYHLPFGFEFNSSIDVPRLTNALQALVRRHAILRTVFTQDEAGVDYQSILDAPLTITAQTLVSSDVSDALYEASHALFDLASSYPIKAWLYEVTDTDKHILFLNIHHVAFDGWSMGIFRRDLQALYKGSELTPLAIQYKDFAHWQRAYLNDAFLENQLTYWQSHLLGHEPLNFPSDYPRPKEVDYRGASHRFELSEELSQALHDLAKQEGVTLYTLLLMSFYLLLSRYTGQTDILIGTVTSNRHYPGVENLLGFFVNTLALRFEVDPLMTGEASIHALSTLLIEAQAHQDMPFEKLLSTLDIPRDTSRHPLFQVFFNLLQTSDDKSLFLKPTSSNEQHIAKFDLALNIQECSGLISAAFNYATSLYKPETITRLVCHYERILLEFVNNLQTPLRHYPLLTDLEYKQIVYDRNQTDGYYPKDKTVHQLFSEQAVRTPHHIALIFEDKRLTYQELEEGSNQLARYIRKQYKQIKPDTLIALALPRSIEMVIGLFAILKAGAAYVPIDLSYPKARISYILEDTQARLVLTESAYTNLFEATHYSLINLDEMMYRSESKTALEVISKPNNLAYVIYTSGTTGQPKGVMTSHLNLTNYVTWMIGHESYQTSSVVDCSSTIAFGATVKVLLVPLVFGQSVSLCDDSTKKDAKLYINYLVSNKVTLINITPSYLAVLLNMIIADNLANELLSLNCLIVGAEKASSKDIYLWRKILPWCGVIHHYGSTEMTVGCISFTDFQSKKIKQSNFLPLGVVSINNRAYILDENQKPVPVGVIGELYFAGAGLARGYFNQPELTAERFIPNPFMTDSDKAKGYTRLYKTGDLVRWLPDGNLEYIGRNDFQVQIRGFRVELGEVEAALSTYPEIKQSLALAKTKNDSHYLISYYVSDALINHDLLDTHLHNQLPEYMVPSVFIHLDAFPLTINGKLDRAALPEPNFNPDENTYVAPRNELELKLCSIWASLLKLERVGIRDDFFRLGGHSILAIQLSHRMSNVLNKTVHVADIFKCKTIAGLLEQINLDVIQIRIEPISDVVVPLSLTQERLWFIERYEEGANAYYIPMAFELSEGISSKRLKEAIQSVVKRHSVFRTVFIQDESGADYQQALDVPLDIRDYTIHEKDLEQIWSEAANKPFDLTAEYPIRAAFYHLPNHKTVLISTIHHVAFDGWSSSVFLRDLKTFYEGGTCPDLPIQYKDFAVFQRLNLQGDKLNQQIKYWQNLHEGYEPAYLPTDYPRPKVFDYQGTNYHFSLDESLSDSLKQLAQSEGVTLYTVLLTGFFILLSRYIGQDDVVLGTTMANRHHPQTEDLIGFFVNTLALRLELNVRHNAVEAIHMVQQLAIEAQAYQDLPLERLLKALDIPRDTSRHALFQILFEVRQVVLDESILNADDLMFEHNIAQFDVALIVSDTFKELKCYIQYATSLYKKSTIHRLSEHYRQVLTQLVGEKQPIKNYSLLTPTEHQQIIYGWNATDKAYPEAKTIHQLFSEQAASTPNSFAVVFEDTKLTYQALDEASNQLARFIRKQYKSLQPDTLIALCLERSLEMIIGILGILKAGGAYVPIDPSYPKVRIDFILQDTKAALVLDDTFFTQDHYLNESSCALTPVSRPNDLAYVMYTSGTTGQPKGVMVEHKSVVNYQSHLSPYFTSIHTVDFSSSFAFDLSVTTTLIPLLLGKCIVIYGGSLQDTKAYGLHLEQLKPDFIKSTPGYLEALLKSDSSFNVPQCFVGGEALKAEQLSLFLEHTQCLYDEYGPTETTVGALLSQKSGKGSPGIGQPIQNTQVYVLDSYLNPVPIGVAGQLYIGGEGLARGYLNQVELTAERFISNPFLEGARLYKTGDKVRWLPDGHLEYIGRNDFQVKIRGFRVELGEVEATLLNHPDIKQAVVLSKTHLVAYYVSDISIHPEALSLYLSEHLPDYMVPSAFIGLDVFPLTINGKLDRATLPEPDFNPAEETYVAPRTELEEKLCVLWASLLEVERVGIKDDFFTLGGDSILAIQLAHRMSQIFNKSIHVSDIFKYKAIAGILEKTSAKGEKIKIEPSSDLMAPLSFAQERLWFIERYEQGTNAYHIPFGLELDSSIDVARLTNALQALVKRHAILRTVFIQDEAGIDYQSILEAPLKIITGSLALSDVPDALRKASHTSFDLTSSYPIKVWLYEVTETDKHILFLSIHHVAFDGWSVDVFRRELQALYEGSELAPLRIQYKDFALWQRSYLAGDVLDEQVTYWKKKLSGYLPLDFPTDHIRPLNLDYSGDTYTFNVTPDVSNKLHALAENLGVTLYTVLLSGFYLLLSRYTEQTDVLIGGAVANRHYPGVDAVLGFFVNTLALRFTVEPEMTGKRCIESLSQMLIEAQAYQDLPFERLLSELKIERDVSRHPLFQIFFDLSYPSGASFLKPLPLHEHYKVAKFDLSLSLHAGEDVISGVFTYATRLYTPETIARLTDHYTTLLSELVVSLDTPVCEYKLLNAQAYQHMVYGWNNTHVDYPQDKTIHQLFSEQVVRTPNNTAVVFEDQQLTYQELDEASNQLSRLIRKQYTTFKPDTLVALYLERSLEMMIAILGVLKAGGAYVPIDPGYPKERIQYMLDDTQSALVLTQQALAPLLNDFSCEVLSLDEAPYAIESKQPLKSISGPHDLAYVIYTSGTTGRPKGVMQSHGNVMRLFTSTESYFGFNENDIWTLYHNYIFDFSVWEMWGALIFGGCLIIPTTSERQDLSAYHALCFKYGVTILNHTPMLFNFLLEAKALGSSEALLPRHVILGGEALRSSDVISWRTYPSSSSFNVVNMYGITETTVHATLYELSLDEDAPCLIGKPLPDLKLYILDPYHNPVPIGVSGELYISGSGLARGYLNQPELTDERFIPNPFLNDGSRMYKTGDLVRWLPEGNLEYIGRNDFQVKVRGYRIELGEVEAALLAYPGVKQSVVLAKKKDDNTYLVAYYVSNEAINHNSLREHLASILPEYMLPGLLICVDAFPLTINGKLDRAALPEPDFNPDEAGYVAPRNDLEIKICSIWASLLNVERVGIYDDFFRIGGDSLLSIRVVSEIKKLGIEISVRDIFIHKTTGNLSSVLQYNSLKESGYHQFCLVNKEKMVSDLNLDLENIEDIYPASYLQSGMLLEYERSDAYHIVISYEIKCKFSSSKFEKIFSELVLKHALLRTSFLQNATYGYVNVQHKNIALGKKIKIHKNNHLSFNEIFNLRRNYDMSIKNPGLFFIDIIPSNRVFTIILTTHHAIEDGWSVASLIAEFTHAYMHNLNIVEENLPSYGEFVEKEIDVIKNKNYSIFWRDYLSNYEREIFTLKLNAKGMDNLSDGCQLESQYALTKQQGETIFRLAEQYETTVDTIFMSLYQYLLSVFLNKSDITIGIVVHNRLEKEGGDKLFGLHLNTIPLRQAIVGDNVEKLFIDTRENKLKIYEYKSYPYGKLKSDMNLLEDVYQCAFNYVHFHIMEGQGRDESISLLDSFGQTNIPLEFNVLRRRDTFYLKFSANNNSIDSRAIEKLKNYIIFYLDQLAQANSRAFELKRIPKAEYQQIVTDWNETDKAYSKDKTIHQIFSEQVIRTPNNIAVVYEDTQLSYQELDETSNQLAHLIRKQYTSLQPDTLIALCVERSLDMIVGILSVLKAGGAYVPIDPSYPISRIQFMLEDTRSELVLTQSRFLSALENVPCKLLLLDQKPYTSESISALKPISGPEDLAYVIYTSGTTGQPKGVMVAHQNINRLVRNTNYIEITNKDCIALTSSMSFDAMTFELWGALLNGAILTLVGQDIYLDSVRFGSFLKQKGITIVALIATIFNQLVDQNPNMFSHLNYLIVGGEAVSEKHFKIALNAPEGAPSHLVTAYGPTENTTFTSTFLVDVSQPVCIGKPISNCVLYVLDDDHNPLPIGVIGELYIGGAGLARGYLNQPELTAERFIPNLFMTRSGKAQGYTRLYKTGDLVRWLPDGNLEYIGRHDFQVKIRGFRIELGEIEAALLTHPDVQQSTVLAKTKNDSQYLIAYYVSDAIINHDALETYVSNQLPAHMVPSAFIHLDALPLTINGKLDRTALPEPDFNPDENTYIAPRNELEIKLCSIWSSFLKIERVGIRDDFFRLGGDSISSIQLVSQMRLAGMNCSVRSIFECRCIERLVDTLNIAPTSLISPEQGVLTGSFALLPLQSWFFEQEHDVPHHYNQSFLVRAPSLSIKQLERMLQQLVDRHDMLRTCFLGSYAQNYQANILLPKIKVLDVSPYSSEALDEELTRWQAHFEFASGPLWQMGYLHGYSDGSARIYFSLHHLIIDTMSLRILMEDLRRLYHDEPLGLKTSSYRQWVSAVLVYGNTHQSEITYWQGVLSEEPTYRLEKNSPQHTTIVLDTSVTEQLLTVAGHAYHTEINDLLLTALAYALSKSLGGLSHLITLEGHGRESMDETLNTSETVGWFTTAYPVHLCLQSNVGQSIKMIKEQLRLIPNKGIGFGALYESLGKPSLPSISFNYLECFDLTSGEWELAPESSGRSIHPDNKPAKLIDMNGTILEEVLHFKVSSLLGASRHEILISAFKKALVLVINHCVLQVQEGRTHYTPSDVPGFIPYDKINVKLNEDPLFIFPPSHGGAESYYHNIVKSLPEKNMVLFNNFYRDLSEAFGRDATHYLRYETLASYYIQHIKSIQKKGPYKLFGWSFGGVLALEIMNQLNVMGDVVSDIILIDSFFNHQESVRKSCAESDLKQPESMFFNINYNYQPNKIRSIQTKVILFKALHQVSADLTLGVENLYLKIAAPSLDCREDNYLSDICDAHIEIIKMEASHFDWVERDTVIKEICNVIMKLDLIAEKRGVRTENLCLGVDE